MTLHDAERRDLMPGDAEHQPLLKQAPKPSFPCLPRVALAALVALIALLGVFV